MQKIATGLGALVVSLGILTGCNNSKNDAVIPSSPVVTETQVEVEEVLQTPMQ